MTAISIAVAIPLIPSQRTSRKEDSYSLLQGRNLKCKRFLSWLWSHCLSDIRQFIFLQVERKERFERIHDIGNKEGKFKGLRRKSQMKN